MDILYLLFYLNFNALVILFLISMFKQSKVLNLLRRALGISFIILTILNQIWSLLALIVYFMLVPHIVSILTKRFDWAKQYKFTTMNVLYLLGPCILAFATGHYVWGIILLILIGGVLYAWKEGIDVYF